MIVRGFLVLVLLLATPGLPATAEPRATLGLPATLRLPATLGLPAEATVTDAGPARSRRVAAGVLPEGSAWRSCEDGPDLVECAWLEVPIDHADPDSPILRLPVRRVRATDPQERIGVLVTIAGGPGQRGTDDVRPATHTAAIHEHFDIVSWDPRGTSHASAIDCIPRWDPFGEIDRTPDTLAERRALDARMRQLASRCRDAHRDLLPFVGTRDTALDLERLRVMLGEPRITILGSSYGSRVALVYATLFPDRVRAVVADGYSDSAISSAERELEQAAAFERELDRLLEACAADRGCPFHSDGEPGVALDHLLEQLDASPLPITGTAGVWLGESDAFEAIAGSLVRGRPARKRLLDALAMAASGDGAALLSIADEIREVYAATGLTLGSFAAISCADDAATWDALDAEAVEDLAARIQAVAPKLGRWLWSPPAADDLPPVGLCAMLPGPVSPPAARVDADGSGPMLVLATTGDPATPIEGARRGVEALESAVLVTLEADHHLAYHVARADPGRPRHRCLIDTVEAFLIELREPADGTICADAGRVVDRSQRGPVW